MAEESEAIDSATESEGTDATDEAELGEKGQRALDRMKADLKAARAEAKEAASLRKQLEAFEQANKTEHEKALDRVRQETEATVRTEVLKTANERIAKAALREHAAGKLNNPADALVFINPSDFAVNEDGEIDSKQVTAAIDGLLKSRPYLGVEQKRQTGSAGQGPQGSGTAGALDMNDLIRRQAGHG